MCMCKGGGVQLISTLACWKYKCRAESLEKSLKTGNFVLVDCAIGMVIFKRVIYMSFSKCCILYFKEFPVMTS